MWRMPYSILMNLGCLPKIVQTLHRMVDQREKYSEEEIYDYVRYIVSLMKHTGKMKTQSFGRETLPPRAAISSTPTTRANTTPTVWWMFTKSLCPR